MNAKTPIARPSPAKKKPAPAKGGGSLKGEIFRQSRIWHGYLSAFAFIALIFFSLTGLLLNHPEWFIANADDKAVEENITLSGAELARTRAAADPNQVLADLIGDKVKLIGAYKSGETVDEEALLGFESVKGRSDVIVNLVSGETLVSVERSDAVTTINELHRGKNAGTVWALVIDLTAVLVLILSLIGYVLFFSLRFRLRTSLFLTAASLAVLIGVFLFAIP